MNINSSRPSRYFIFNDKVYLQMDYKGRITIPQKLYVHQEDAYLFCTFTVPEDNVILIQYDREKSPRQCSQPTRLYIPLKIRERYKFDRDTLFECTPIEDGFRLRRIDLKGVLE